ncbi:chromosomal replication initiator protein DnaA [bacterium (Candidatus Blackallbacteria) CG17_big_fil_post_rev_8_21_14_2_50_48_46]|uniref:Chromosomal replication initiator protein DnaA n=1 Tax=bacterium (Candidatus Blackallbacteria) CG17_big_fil_post_rev_8_21_14_2_50_48_46 TaxID=2014261 RepID=A0A2M7G563_9BACT|nr:MAG: chromosomal replication initiator protein DnaA [bacterium (Candidatus Blackallbacteria) CG18_big_fil_WC_8_21_14_2_50_49_26]PIW17028.1 MAG: chromosomal replication initiator protein DnaA [bacterium (Candidatus Blackallbacteria) CG17_big_fil_post_rev_8_21_14_2_50_48_46]PIW48164.1 MAG: chromosomal replication initiator protein DnaA [bacterium (Candidatus Blackallbacteria) CG13_big_fil_rev_8_21_14_2_50_49_14]
MSYDLDALWQQTLAILKERISEPTYESFVRQSRAAHLKNNQLVIETPNGFTLNFLSRKYSTLFKEILEEISGQEMEVVFEVNDSMATDLPAPPANHSRPSGTLENRFAAKDRQLQQSNLNERYTFDNFVVGSHNKFAHATAWRVAEAPGKAFNPLFIHGGVGLGKTHLMQAIGHHLLAKHENMRVMYISSERFTNELINAIKDGSQMAFKNRYRTTDLLLIDDIQFIGNKESTQEEFFHTFNDLYEAGKQIVITSDRPPREISTLEDRLRSRFEMGLISDIQPPELETRIAILKKKAEMDGMDVPDEVLHYIARVYINNVRELEGALLRIMAYTSLTNTLPTIAVAQSVLGQAPERELSPERIQEVVAEFYRVTLTEMRGPGRSKAINTARQVAIYLCCELTELSTPRIGELFGNRDHTTILHGRDKIKNLLKEDQKLQQELQILMDRFK